VAAGGRSDRGPELSLADSGGPIAFFNQAIPLRPLTGLDDPLLDSAERFYVGAANAATLLSLWPTPDLSARGWALGGHPAFVARPPGPHAAPHPDVDVRLVQTAAASSHTAHGIVDLCFAATLPEARRHGAWSTLLWARVDDHPDLPAVAFTSDFSRPGFERLGFLVLTRFTLWWRSPG
jgi:hypothetical protein